MPAKKNGRNRQHGKAGEGRARRSGPTPSVVAAPSTLWQNAVPFPTLELRSPLSGPAPAPTEEMLFDLKEAAGSRPFASLAEVNRELDRLVSAGPILRSDPVDPRARAQRLAYDAWNQEGKGGALLAHKALALDSDAADAYLYLAAHPPDPEQVLELAVQAVEAGKRFLAKEKERDVLPEDGELWSYLPCRPYLRARAFLAKYAWNAGGRLTAVGLAEESLAFDKGDALGLRYLLLGWYLDMGEEVMSRQLLDRHKGERSTFYLYGDALLTYWERGEDRTAKARLARALKANSLVAERLLFDPPDSLEVLAIPSYSPGSTEEADLCAYLLGPAWDRDLEALDWLMEASGIELPAEE